MFVYSNDSMPNLSAIALIAGTSQALRFETTMLILIASPASWKRWTPAH